MAGYQKYGFRTSEKRGSPPKDKNISTDGSEYAEDELEFIYAVEEWKRTNRTRFPKFTDILAIAKSLGYRKGAQCSTSSTTASPESRG